MKRLNFFRFIFLLLLLLSSEVRGYGHISTISEDPAGKDIYKSGELIEAAGIIEPTVEITGGISLQRIIHKFKKFSGSSISFSLKQGGNTLFTDGKKLIFSSTSFIPLYILNRSIIL